MAESSILWETSGTGDGTGTGYTDEQMFQLFRMLCPSSNRGGVAPDVLNELAVTGTASPVAVNTGSAIVYGIPYFNSASENVAIPTPAVSTRIDRIVLRASWAAQTVRITRIAGTEGAGAPSLTQNAGTTWDIPLAQASITTGGVITVTDQREWLGLVGDGMVTLAKMANLAVDTGQLVDEAVSTAKIENLAVTTGKIADDQITGAKIADYAVDPRSHISGTNGIVVDPQNGNARGTDAVDLQTVRTNAANVASGDVSTIAGGSDNRASDIRATVGGGYNNHAKKTAATIAGGSDNANDSGFGAIGGGTNNEITGASLAGTIAGGWGNELSGSYGAIGGGQSNSVTADFSAIPGGTGAKTRVHGQEAYAHESFSATGDAQRSVYIQKKATTNNTPVVMESDQYDRLTLPSDSTWAFRILVVARRTDADNESAAYEFVGCIDNNAGTVALVGTVTKTVIAEDTSGWDVNVTANNTNDCLDITVTGENSKTIRWVATIWTVEVTG